MAAYARPPGAEGQKGAQKGQHSGLPLGVRGRLHPFVHPFLLRGAFFFSLNLRWLRLERSFRPFVPSTIATSARYGAWLWDGCTTAHFFGRSLSMYSTGFSWSPAPFSLFLSVLSAACLRVYVVFVRVALPVFSCSSQVLSASPPAVDRGDTLEHGTRELPPCSPTYTRSTETGKVVEGPASTSTSWLVPHAVMPRV